MRRFKEVKDVVRSLLWPAQRDSMPRRVRIALSQSFSAQFRRRLEHGPVNGTTVVPDAVLSAERELGMNRGRLDATQGNRELARESRERVLHVFVRLTRPLATLHGNDGEQLFAAHDDALNRRAEDGLDQHGHRRHVAALQRKQ